MQTNNSQKINISSLHKGSYILSIRCNTDERISKKIIKY
ncbi:MAG: T9SS type A sorting domain-containing protein [Paludibacter sp.]|nr:T9SS type A sorting domain-containing protein [Paludibacter sp.]